MKERQGNVLDLFFVLLLILSAVGVGGRFLRSETYDGEETEMLVRVRIPVSDASLEECLHPGERTYLSTGEYYGVLEALESERAEVRLFDGGRFVSGTWEEGGPREYLLTVRVKGRIRENVFYREGREAVLVGREIEVWGEYARVFGTVTEVLPDTTV